MALMSYVTQDRHGTYYFRRIIPEALRPFMPDPWKGKREWKRSLATKDPKAARRLGTIKARDCSIDFQMAEIRQGRSARSDLSPEEIASIAEWWRRVSLEQDDEFRLSAHEEDQRIYEAVAGDLRSKAIPGVAWPAYAANQSGMSQRQVAKKRETASLVLAASRAALGMGDTSSVEGEVKDVLQTFGIKLPGDAPAFRRLALTFLEAQISSCETVLCRLDGQIIRAPAPGIPRGDGAVSVVQDTGSTASQVGPKISEALAEWKAGSPARGSHKPSQRTTDEADYAVRRFIEFHGDVAIGSITREMARQFRDALARLPTRAPAAMQRMGIRELLALDHSKRPKVHAKTVNKLVTMVSAVLAYAIKEGSTDALVANPMANLKLTISGEALKARKEFDAAHLRTIFSTPIYAQGDRPAGGAGEAAFWLPLIALLSGARQGELAQLRIKDLRQDPETGIWVIDISYAGGGSLKNVGSERVVPLHPDLERIGLLQYRQSLLTAGSKPEGYLFPDIKPDSRGRRAGLWSKWSNRYLREAAGIEGREQVFHSFRHTFKRLVRGGVSEEISDMLSGHTGRGRIGRSYGRGADLVTLATAIRTIKAPDVIEGLTWQAAGVSARPRVSRRVAPRAS